ncbi:MAG: SMC-Scp complex subunit ScpB [Planctomycetaceae bacterium]|jgi:segregation and condensation protein B|nr:SMC-Scp complex subunit ScpB [Planctomycetaceae bacterium]
MIHPFNLRRLKDNWFCCRDRTRTNNFLFSYEKSSDAKKDVNDSINEFKIIAPIDDADGEQIELSENDFQRDLLSRVEAVLFLSREPLTIRRISQLAELPEGTRVKQILRELNERYDKHRISFRIVEVAGGVQLRTRPEFASWLLRIQEAPVIVRLSSPAMETLAVIAYKQPVHRAEIEKLRGVQCGDMIRQLLEKNLVKIVGRSEELGRPFFYGTTKYFQQIFGLKNLNDLPDYETLMKKE